MTSARGFGSDNHASIHPQILESIMMANKGHAHSYGLDEITNAVEEKVKELFGKQASSYFVYNGTAANILALKACNQTFNSVICSDVSHINVDECGGPEVIGGYKLIPIPSTIGKIQLPEIKRNLIRRGDQHFSQVKTISITQPTELGTCYTLAEIKSICQWAHQNQLYVHMDGARFANACVHLNCSFADLTTEVGVDVLSFGGTKNGLLMGEMVIFLNPEINKHFKFLRKQIGHLPSKSRFIAAQFRAYLSANLWYEIAQHSCHLAKKLAEKLRLFSDIKILFPVESNAIFAIFPKEHLKELRKEKFFYIWDEHTFSARLMFSWDNQDQDIDDFIEKIKALGIT